ncbi:winged helix-turn-helix transcriptional regulator [Nocardia sp. NPDC052278]|uniref:winged helix-turn-helix transcriptional regulator n=1 Tax=unclassified Nocardia TaxID=2637762 RepID=UPI0036B4DB2D
MTAEERRQSAKAEYDAFVADCPTRELLATISDKWVTLVLTALAEGPLRHGGLRRRIAGVSQKMLTQTLRSLERAGLVDRTVTPSVPVRVDYSLTPLGHSLLPVVTAVKIWAEGNMDDVHDAQHRFDRRQAGEI